MATLQDFKSIFQDQVHEFAGDAHLEELVGTLDSIILLAKQEERERIIAMLDWVHSDSDVALCKNYRREEEAAMGVPEIRAFLDPAPIES